MDKQAERVERNKAVSVLKEHVSEWRNGMKGRGRGCAAKEASDKQTCFAALHFPGSSPSLSLFFLIL